MERQSDLPWHEWLIACLTTQGIKQEEIGDLIGRGERTVNTIISDLKQRIVQELNCDIESVNLAQISRWLCRKRDAHQSAFSGDVVPASYVAPGYEWV